MSTHIRIKYNNKYINTKDICKIMNISYNSIRKKKNKDNNYIDILRDVYGVDIQKINGTWTLLVNKDGNSF